MMLQHRVRLYRLRLLAGLAIAEDCVLAMSDTAPSCSPASSVSDQVRALSRIAAADFTNNAPLKSDAAAASDS